ncbi:MAG: hypothetical protein Q7T62_18340 [Undibacterium sp.]|nr:hypothetical protein [Undibacterium sp.]
MHIHKSFSIYNLASLIAVFMLSACGGSVSDKVGEILNESKIISVSINPNPLPQPIGNTPTPFSLKVKVDATSTFDVITVNLKDPANGGQYSLLAYPSPCSSNKACGMTTYEIQCLSFNAVNNNALRTISCGDMKLAVTLPPGTHPMLIEIRHLDILLGLSKHVDDSATVNLLIQ